MKQEITPVTSTRLMQLQGRFEQWRQSREKRSSIPEELLDEAAKLTRSYSIHQVSRTLRLNHTVLKKRAEDISEVLNTAPAFMEFNISPSLSLPNHHTVEMERADGAKLKMNFSSRADLDLLELGKAFLGDGK